MTPALFEIDGDRFVPTELTRGGWSDDAQHGSPPSGILARAVESVPTAASMQVARFTVDLFREVPLRPLNVDTVVLRDGRRIQVVEGRLRHGDVEVGRAVALKIRVDGVDDAEELVGNALDEPPPSPGPDALQPLEWRRHFGMDTGLLRFHTDGVEIRTVAGSFLSRGPGESWFRLGVDIVSGEEPTPFQRAATLADLANGNSQALDPRRWIYVNPDITLYLHRLPVGEWLGMKSVAHQWPSGVGMTDTVLFDTLGALGRIGQAQLLARRR